MYIYIFELKYNIVECLIVHVSTFSNDCPLFVYDSSSTTIVHALPSLSVNIPLGLKLYFMLLVKSKIYHHLSNVCSLIECW